MNTIFTKDEHVLNS